MSGHHLVVEDRKADAVTHLAIARSQNTENGILGDKKHERGKQLRKQLLTYYVNLSSMENMAMETGIKR